MAINDFAFACAIDGSMPYFTYENETMLIIQAAEDAKTNMNSFARIEPFMPGLIAHESLHVCIKKMEGASVSDSLDDLEIIIEHNGIKFQVTLNNMLFAKDSSGLVIP
jgi:hypothetical protein